MNTSYVSPHNAMQRTRADSMHSFSLFSSLVDMYSDKQQGVRQGRRNDRALLWMRRRRRGRRSRTDGGRRRVLLRLQSLRDDAQQVALHVRPGNEQRYQHRNVRFPCSHSQLRVKSRAADRHTYPIISFFSSCCRSIVSSETLQVRLSLVSSATRRSFGRQGSSRGDCAKRSAAPVISQRKL